MLGNEVMIAPVYTQNAKGRYVYLPERMMLVKFSKNGEYTKQVLERGHHFVEVALDEVPMFIREGRYGRTYSAGESGEMCGRAGYDASGDDRFRRRGIYAL